MRKSSKKLLAFLLVFIMMFAASATVISAAYGQNNDGVQAQNESQTVPEGSFSLDWFEVSYSGNDIVVTVRPQYAEEILSLTKADVKQLARFVLEASKEVVLDDFVDALAGTGDHGSTVEFGRTVIGNALDFYLKNNYGATDNDAFIMFFEDVMASDKEVLEFAEFFCTLIDAAVISRTVPVSDFPTPEDFDGEMDKMLTEEKYKVISAYFDDEFAKYEAYKTGKTGIAPSLVDIIDNYGRSYIKTYLMNSGKSEAEAEYILNNYSFGPDDYADFFASAEFDKESIKEKVLADTAALDKAMLATVGCTFADIDTRIAEVEVILHNKYVEVYNRINSGDTGIEDLVGLLDLVDYINVNNYALFGTVDGKGQVFYTDTLVQLAKEIPTFEEIANMENDEMQLAYEFAIGSEVGTSEFSVTFKLGGGYEKVRKIARIIADNVTFDYYGGGSFALDVNVPDELAKAALKACESDKISDEIKQKVFAAFTKTPDDVYALVNDVTLDELLQIFDYVDFEGILDSKYLSRFESLDGLTEEQVKNKIKEYERYYNKAVNVLKKIYGYVPESVTEKTLVDFYDGNGKFSASGDATVDIVNVVGKVNDLLADLIDGFVDDTVVSISANVSVKFQDVYRVTYYQGTEVVRDGFLPVGADIEFFSGKTEYNGHPIIAWVDANGTEYTEMPEADVELYAITAIADAALTVTANDKVYDGEEIELHAEATPFHPSATYAYAWYKDGVLIDGATLDTITVTDVEDSGEYYCVITIVDYGVETVLTTNKETVNITKKGITLSDAIEWTNDGPFIYDGNPHGVTVAVKAEYASLVSLASISGNEATDAKDDYNAIAKFTVIDPNYEFTGSDESAMPWAINPKTFDDSDITWVGGSFEYDYGNERSVSATYPAELEVSITDNKATNAGNYTAKAVVTVAGGNTNYAWVGSAVVEYAWTIAPKVIDLSTFAWAAYNNADPNHDPANFAFVFNGEVQGVRITNLPVDIAPVLIYIDASATNATTANLIATATIDDDAYKALTGASVYSNYTVATDSTGAYKAFREYEWGIAKAVITVENVDWTDYSGKTYDGVDYAPELNYSNSDLNINYVYEIRLADGTYDELKTGQKPNKAGYYRASVIITAVNNDNFRVNYSNIKTEIEFNIAERKIAIDGIKWDYVENSFTYDTFDHTVTLDTSVIASDLAFVNITGNTDTQKNAGTYTINAVLSLVDSESCVFTVAGNPVAQPVEYSCTWKINKASVKLDDCDWIYDVNNAPVYNNNEFEIKLDTTGIADLVNVSYTGNKATGASNYTAKATVSLVDPDNYEFTVAGAVVASPAEYELNWTIKKATIALDGAKWDYTAPFTYTGNDYTVNFTTVLTAKELELVTITGDKDTQKNAGKYPVKATVTLKDPANYEFVVSGEATSDPVEYSETWEIKKATITLDGSKWDYTAPFTYTGNDYTVNFTTVLTAKELELVTITGDKDTQKNAGKYPVKATVTLKDPANYEFVVSGEATSDPVEYSETWEIKKATTYGVTFSDITVEFDAEGHSIFVEGTLPTGVEAIYDGNNVFGIGKHLVTATIPESDNYEEEVLTAYITINIRATDTIINQFQSGYLVIVTVKGDGLSSGYTLNSEIVNDAYANIDLSSIAREGYNVKLARAYEINFEYGGHVAQANGDFTVRICVPTESFGAEDKNLAIVYIADDGSIQTVEGIRSGNYMLFDTTHFSVYGIVEYTEIVEEEPEDPFVCPGHEDDNGDGKCDHCGEDYTAPPFVCPGHEDNDFDGKCDHCGEGMEIPPECTHVDNNFDGKCDKCGKDLSDNEPVITPEPTDNTWVWILIAIIVAVIIALLIFVVMKKNDDEDDGYTEPTPTVPTPEDDSEEEAPVEEAPVEEAPAEEAPAEEAPVEEAPVEEAPVEEAPAEEAPVEEAPVEEASVEEAPVEEASVEEASVEEAPVEEAPVEEAPVEEAPVEPAGPSYAAIFAASENADAVRLVNGVVVPVRYRTSFMSRLIQSEEPIQTYYTIVKNYLLSFKGVKARTSWNFESFNKGRIQCAKLNVKGSAFQVYLGLDTNEYSEDKYHFVYAGDKPKLDKVPMMMKVKSERSLKYTLELIDEVMRKNGIEQTAVPEVDYHMPYESTEALVDKDMVKVILPDGMEIDENTIIEKVNVGNLLKDMKPVEEAPVEEAPAEEAPVEEAPVEEAPVEEAPVEEAPVEEIPKVHIVDHHVLEEEIVQVDSVKADVIISDEQAKELIETITREGSEKPKSNKCYEVNLDVICENFEDGETVDIKALKEKRLISKKADKVKILARGVMTKRLTVVADKFSIQAVKMIGLAGGLAQKYEN